MNDKGVKVVTDSTGFTTLENQIRTKDGIMYVQESLMDALNRKDASAQLEFLYHGLHDFYAIVSDELIAGRNTPGNASFIHYADYLFEKAYSGINSANTSSKLARARNTILRELGIDIYKNK